MSRSSSCDSYDELPLWSAPFGLMLLDTIRLKQGMKVLDVGSGSGFPMLEIADRLGNPGQITGIDPSEEANQILSEKIIDREIPNASIIKAVAEQMPFGNNQFDLITSNNGLNNVTNQAMAFSECYRVAKPGAQLVATMNLPHTMIEFYEIFEEVLQQKGLIKEVALMHEHISEKRKSVEYLQQLIIQTGFKINSINIDGFKYQFTSAEALFRHYLIRNYFLGTWETIIPSERQKEVMSLVSEKIDHEAEKEGLFTLSIPFVCLDCNKTD
ncbi:MAG: methyltransferase domain-containing protein [Deltaproteobacteria bacterium]|nr:methyltransferase domain-containing protein [Deltaproteobacteria bacterium]